MHAGAFMSGQGTAAASLERGDEDALSSKSRVQQHFQRLGSVIDAQRNTICLVREELDVLLSAESSAALIISAPDAEVQPEGIGRGVEVEAAPSVSSMIAVAIERARLHEAVAKLSDLTARVARRDQTIAQQRARIDELVQQAAATEVALLNREALEKETAFICDNKAQKRAIEAQASNMMSHTAHKRCRSPSAAAPGDSDAGTAEVKQLRAQIEEGQRREARLVAALAEIERAAGVIRSIVATTNA